jgi:hypothetical protein
MYLGTIYIFLPNLSPIELQIWPPGGHLGEKKQSAITIELMVGSAPNVYHMYRFLI